MHFFVRETTSTSIILIRGPKSIRLALIYFLSTKKQTLSLNRIFYQSIFAGLHRLNRIVFKKFKNIFF
jgi:hypothetical protein